jgi:hypothetical protein
MGYPPAHQQRPMPVDPAMRAASVDRERAVDVLKAGFAEGRLTQDEYNERMTRAYAARTYGELAIVTGDLPAGPMPVSMPPPWQAQPQPWQAPPRAAQTNGLATAALVLGLLEFVTMGLTAIPAIICGHVARGQIKRTGEQGDGMAVTGLVLGYLAIAFGVVLVTVAAVAFTRSGQPVPQQGVPLPP